MEGDTYLQSVGRAYDPHCATAKYIGINFCSAYIILTILIVYSIYLSYLIGKASLQSFWR